MKNFLLLPLLFATFCGLAQNHQLSILVKNVENSRGNILIQVLNEEEQMVASGIIPARGEKEENIFQVELAAGRYAVRAYHDINSNEELDQNAIGVPSEPYGFSDNTGGTFGPPDIEDQLVMIDRDSRITVTLE